MATRARQAEPFYAQDQERPTIRLLERALRPEVPQAKLVGENGEEISLPQSVYHAFKQLVHLMASGHAAYLVPLHRELTTQEAAELLNVSRPFVSQLLDQQEIPYVRVGSHRRIRVADLLEYQQRREVRRRAALDELTQVAQEDGLYEGEE